MEFLDAVYGGNKVSTWLIAIALTTAVFVGLYLIKTIIIVRLKKLAQRTETTLDDFVISLLSKARYLLLPAFALFAGIKYLKLPPAIDQAADFIMWGVFLLQIAIWVNSSISYVVFLLMRKRGTDHHGKGRTAITMAVFVARLVAWSFFLLLMLDFFGINITAMVGALGIGGVAVALAVQTLLGDFIGSLSIVLDKPFETGDFISLDSHMGTIEEIGWKTTRLKSLSGEQLIVSNSDLLRSRIRNFNRMEERRVLIKIAVIYSTPYEKLVKIPQIIKSIVEAQEQTRFERSHFFEYGSSSLDFETVFWVLSPDYVTYMDIRQAVNLEIFRMFKKEGIEFAIPTQTINLAPRSVADGGLKKRKKS